MKPPIPRPEAHEAESPYKGVGGLKRVLNALRYSARGLMLAWRIESAFRQELILALILVPLALILPLSALERLALIGSTLLVLMIELLNSSVEAAIDRISLDHHRLSGRAKDFGSAAVFIALVFCALSWVLIAGPLVLTALGHLG